MAGTYMTRIASVDGRDANGRMNWRDARAAAEVWRADAREGLNDRQTDVRMDICKVFG